MSSKPKVNRQSPKKAQAIIFTSAEDNSLGYPFRWHVTPYGIERSDGGYLVEASRLTELATWTDPNLYDWPLHANGKNWDWEIFISAWLVALAFHQGRYTPALDRKTLMATLAKVRKKLPERNLRRKFWNEESDKIRGGKYGGLNLGNFEEIDRRVEIRMHEFREFEKEMAR